MPAMKVRYFRVVFYNRDARTINFSDIVTDDRIVTDRTDELQCAGRNVNISTTNPETDRKKVPSIEALRVKLPEGYTYDPNLRW
jgi:hypothetical protein